MFDRLARLTYRRPKSVLAGVAVFFVAAIALGGNVADRLVPAGFSDPDSESAVAADRTSGALGFDADPGLIVLAEADGAIDSPAARAEVARLAEEIGADPEVAFVRTAFDGGAGEELISEDGRTTAILAHFTLTDEGELDEAVERVPEAIVSDSLELQIGGFAVGFNQVNETVREDLLRAELIVFPILAILLLIVFRGVVAAAIPLAIGGIAVVGTFLALRLLSELTDISIFALNITTALGLGLAVDYGLLLVSRYREELERHGAGEEAHRVMVATAGRTVLYSGLTVAAAMAAMMLLPQTFLFSMGAGGASVALLAAGAALFATPAMLALLGERVNALGVRRGRTEAGTGRWHVLATWVMRRPARVAITTTIVLIALALPVLAMTLTTPGIDAVPRGNDSREVSERLAGEFTPNLDAPISAVVPGGPANAERIAAELADDPGLLAVATPHPLPGVGSLVQATPADPPLSVEAQDTARRIRAAVAPVDGLVNGQTAQLIDLKQSLIDNGPIVLALVALTTMILLFLMTGSVILPIKTLIMNVLSIMAMFGLLVIVFQWGLLSPLFGYDGPAAVETALIVVLAATTFGLATDYAVLVLSRIKEFHDKGLPNEEAVAMGMERTGRVITAAAVLLAVVFLGFTTSSVFFMKQAGFGQAVAVLIDASIVRALLVPSLMALLGRWNWWAPRPLRRLHARFGLSEGPEPETARS